MVAVDSVGDTEAAEGACCVCCACPSAAVWLPSWFCVCSRIFTTSIGLSMALISIHDRPPAAIFAAIPSVGEGTDTGLVRGRVNGAVIGMESFGRHIDTVQRRQVDVGGGEGGGLGRVGVRGKRHDR